MVMSGERRYYASTHRHFREKFKILLLTLYTVLNSQYWIFFLQNLMKMHSAVLLLVVLVCVSTVHSQEFDKSLLRRLYNELAT